MKKFISFLRNNEIIDQFEMPSGWTDGQVIDLDEFLRKIGLLTEDEEIAVTYDTDY